MIPCLVMTVIGSYDQKWQNWPLIIRARMSWNLLSATLIEVTFNILQMLQFLEKMAYPQFMEGGGWEEDWCCQREEVSQHCVWEETKIQPKTTDLNRRLWGINSTKLYFPLVEKRSKWKMFSHTPLVSASHAQCCLSVAVLLSTIADVYLGTPVPTPLFV